MRITQNLLFDQIRFHIQNNSNALLRLQERVATGKRINRMSDDPVEAPRLLDVKRSFAQLDQYVRNIQRADTVAGLYDTTLGQAEDLIVRAKELLLGEANEVTSTPETREAARLEIASLASQLVQLGNTQLNGVYIYSGFAVNTPAYLDAGVAVAAAGGNTGAAAFTSSAVLEPNQIDYSNFQIVFTSPTTYDIVNTSSGSPVVTGAAYASGQPIQWNGIEVVLTGAPAAGDAFNVALTPPGAYQGDGGVQNVEVQSGQTVALNVLGSRVFNGAGSPGSTDVFGVLNRINTALRSNDRTEISNLLNELDGARQQLTTERASIGTRQNLFKTVLDRHIETQDGLELIRSQIEDADLTEAITELTQQKTAYEASLGAAAQISQLSLLDFLR